MSVIILAINKSDSRYHSYDCRQNWSPLSSITFTYRNKKSKCHVQTCRKKELYHCTGRESNWISRVADQNSSTDPPVLMWKENKIFIDNLFLEGRGYKCWSSIIDSYYPRAALQVIRDKFFPHRFTAKRKARGP